MQYIRRNYVKMGKILTLLGAAVLLCAGNAGAQTTLKILDTVLFYDGYAGTVSKPVQPGVIRHRNDLYATKLSSTQLGAIGNKLGMKVTIKAVCDNYDRIGNVNLAFVPKGAAAYRPDTVKRIEISRFITPFMDMNKKPDTVGYYYEINNIARLLKETSITSSYDVWLELEVFGVPYAANNEIAGCSGRNDVFYGSVEWTTSGPTGTENTNMFLPLLFKKNLNNYQAAATDELTKTRKTVSFDLSAPLEDAVFVLITSNHGANTGGEEYNRRNHFVSLDGVEVHHYIPGRISCEPYRKYNTQGNGIYGRAARSDAEWQSFSNWCPGDVIVTRIIELGPLTAGRHEFKIEVPDAVFPGKEGNIPLSLYLQGSTAGKVLSLPKVGVTASEVSLYPNPATDNCSIRSAVPVEEVNVYDMMGQLVVANAGLQFSTAQLAKGIYQVQVHLRNQSVERLKLICQ
jgi:hypothetical protein